MAQPPIKSCQEGSLDGHTAITPRLLAGGDPDCLILANVAQDFEKYSSEIKDSICFAAETRSYYIKSDSSKQLQKFYQPQVEQFCSKESSNETPFPFNPLLATTKATSELYAEACATTSDFAIPDDITESLGISLNAVTSQTPPTKVYNESKIPTDEYHLIELPINPKLIAQIQTSFPENQIAFFRQVGESFYVTMNIELLDIIIGRLVRANQLMLKANPVNSLEPKKLSCIIAQLKQLRVEAEKIKLEKNKEKEGWRIGLGFGAAGTAVTAVVSGLVILIKRIFEDKGPKGGNGGSVPPPQNTRYTTDASVVYADSQRRMALYTTLFVSGTAATMIVASRALGRTPNIATIASAGALAFGGAYLATLSWQPIVVDLSVQNMVRGASQSY